MLNKLFFGLVSCLVLAACSEKPAPAPIEKTEVQGLMDKPDVKAPDARQAPKKASDLTPAQLIVTLRQAYTVPEDDRAMEEIRKEGMLPETRAVMDRCVEDMRFSGAVETACIGLPLPKCPGMEGTTSDMVACNAMEYDYWDERLNLAYEDLLKAVRKEDEERVDDGPYPVVLADSVQQAQRAWLAFRQYQCEYEYNLFRGGTMGRITGSSCMRVLTAKRAIELEQMMANHDLH